MPYSPKSPSPSLAYAVDASAPTERAHDLSARRLRADALQDDYYDRDSERSGVMDIIVRTNRQARLGDVAAQIDSRLRSLPITVRGGTVCGNGE